MQERISVGSPRSIPLLSSKQKIAWKCRFFVALEQPREEINLLAA
jgi:hypothetical protein